VIEEKPPRILYSELATDFSLKHLHS